MNLIIQKSLQKSIAYNEYRDLVSKLSNQAKTSGKEQLEHLINFTKLNDARMHRLDKTLQTTSACKTFLENIKSEYIWLVLTESWCGDAAQILPVLNKMRQESDKIDLRIVFRDENDALMDLFLTNNTRSVPKLIILDKNTLEVKADFGPRPAGAKQLITDYKATHGIVDETAKIELQKWYLQDKGISTQNEIIELMR